jgi:hypothetical protein
MLTSDLTTTTPVATFSAISTRATSTLRSDAAQPLDEPRIVTVSHETQKNGKVSSVIYIDDTKNVLSGVTVVPSLCRVQLKLQYNPLEGRVDIDATMAELYAQLTEIVSTGTNFDKILNKEH